MATGWNTGLCQDYDRGLGRWFADRLGAREQLRRMCMPKYITEALAWQLAKTVQENIHPADAPARTLTFKQVHIFAESAIQAHIEQCASELPSLPAPIHFGLADLGYTEEQLRAYGVRCAAQAREQALSDATFTAWQCASPEGSAYGNGYNQAAIDIERAIRKLMVGNHE